MAVRHSTHAMIRCLCEWWKYRAKTLARGGVGAGASIARQVYRIVWLRVGIAVSVAECFYGLGTGALIICLCYAPPTSMSTTIPRLVPTSLNPTILSLPLPATTPRLRSSISGGPRVWPCFRPTFGGRLPASRGGLCGVGPRVGTSKPTSPLGRRRRYLAPARVLDAKKYAHHLVAASRPAWPDPGRSGRVSSKQSWSNNHGRAPPALG